MGAWCAHGGLVCYCCCAAELLCVGHLGAGEVGYPAVVLWIFTLSLLWSVLVEAGFPDNGPLLTPKPV